MVRHPAPDPELLVSSQDGQSGSSSGHVVSPTPTPQPKQEQAKQKQAKTTTGGDGTTEQRSGESSPQYDVEHNEDFRNVWED